VRRGLALVETLVVVAIVTALAGLILSVVLRSRGSSKVAACQSNLKQIATSMLLYAGGHDDAILVEVHPYIRKHPGTYGEPYDGALGRAALWPTEPLRYGATRERFRCPLDLGSETGVPTAFPVFGTSYLNDTLGGLVFRTFSAVPDPTSQVLLMDGLGSNHGRSPGRDPFRVLFSCMAYDGHVRNVRDLDCSMTEVPFP
jgi:hypothetical protein